MMQFRIVQSDDTHLSGFNHCVDVVARERRYLGLIEGPTLEQTRAFVRAVRAEGGVHLVAVNEQANVVGWCDIARNSLPGFTHCGRLGMGLLPEVRGHGVGARLVRAAVDAARERGIERIELEVFASNTRALQLYERLGFEREGVKRQARKLDGAVEDNILMARLLTAE
jgi:RimJ/RimL family protein N-acetyltransferase